MSLESRPYIGTFALNGKELVQYTPDALVFINGDTSLPGCSACSGRIDFQQFLTEVSVDAGTEPGSASASFTLSIPLHHSDSLARDARFLLKPALEVHIYMRGYFPVAGLYSHLAEPKGKSELTGGAGFLPPAEATPSVKPLSTAHYSPQSFLDEDEALTGLSAAQIGELNKLAMNMETLHQYLDQIGQAGHLPNFNGRVFIGNTDGFASGGHVEDSQHYRGQAVDLVARYTNTDGRRVKVDPTVLWAAAMKLRGGKMSQGGVGAYVKVTPKPGTVPGSTTAEDYTPTGEWTGVPHYDTRGRAANWYWFTAPDGTKIKQARIRPPQFNPVLNSLPDPDSSVLAWNAQPTSAKEIPLASPDLPEGHDPRSPEATHEGGFALEGERATQAQFGPSLLEEMGLEGTGVDKTLAYPYYHVFHGVVTEVGHSYSGGVNTVSVNCSSMLHFWQYHNMSTNASVFGARPTNSKNKMSLVGHNFTGMHPYEIIYTLHYDTAGAAGEVGWALSSKTNQTAVSDVGGESLFSLAVRYWERRFQGRVTRLRMHGATGELFSTLAAAWLARTSSSRLTRAMRERYSTRKSDATKKVLGEATTLGLNNKNRRSALLATRLAARSRPGGAENSPKFEINVLEMQAFVSNISNWGQVNLFESSYESKLDVAQKVCEVTGFEFYQDVDGDLVFKPPFYNMDTSGSRVYRIEDIDIINISFSEKEPQVTYMTVKGSQFKGLQGHGMENEWGVRGQYIDYRMVAQFGWRPGSYETAYFNDPKSMFFAAVNRMDMLNIGINSASVTIPERPELRPGFPVYIPYLDCYYYCNSFAHSHSVGGQCTTSLQLVGKRAKFYAPGDTRQESGAPRGIHAIKLGDTRLPPRPLETIGPDGKLRLAGFPNVVMTLDPTAINPLFFVVGMDVENIADARVVKYLLDIGVQLQIVSEATPATGGGLVYTMDSLIAGVGGSDGTPLRVAFYFNESDLKTVPHELASLGKDAATLPINILIAATTYNDLLQRQDKALEKDQDRLFDVQDAITDLNAEIFDLRQGPNQEKAEKAIIKLEDKVEKKTQEKQRLEIEIQAKTAAEQAKWKDPGNPEMNGVAFLLELWERVGEQYRSQANFQSRTDLGSTVSLLDMLSDKKAIFTNGTQPGQYRYYSASHPDPNEQGPPHASYDTQQVSKLVTAKPLPIDGLRPTVSMFADNPTAPFPGAKIPEVTLRDGKPTNGIRVLNNNATRGANGKLLYPNGEVLSTSDVMELMFSVQDVTVLKTVTTSFRRNVVGNLGKGVRGKLAATFRPETVGREPTATTTLQGYFGTVWDNLRGQVGQAIAAMVQAASSNGATLTGLAAPGFPGSVRVWKGAVGAAETFGSFKYRGSSGTKDLGSQGAKATLGEFVTQAGAALGSALYSRLNGVRKAADKQMKAAGLAGDVREQVLGAFNSALAGLTGAKVSSGTRGYAKRKAVKRDTTFSPVFPVSDDRGYEVIGSYRYGRGVDIEPRGVFDQLHRHDIFSLVDKNLADQVLRFFVQGKKSIVVTEMVTEETPTGQKVTKPRTVKKAGAQAAKWLNDEVLRQLRAANLTDKQILDYGLALQGDEDLNQLTFSLANYFADTEKDGVHKVPVINAAFSLADLNIQHSGHICDCKAAEADVLISAFGQEQFLAFSQAGSPAHEGLGADPADAGTRWVAQTMGQASTDWSLRQAALRGQVLDRGGSHVIQTVRSAAEQLRVTGGQVANAAEAFAQQADALATQAEEEL